jgi:hypothetical protein
MLTLSLTPAERDLVLDILNNYYSDFRFEIGATSTPDYRTELQAQKELLMNVLDKLKAAK